MGVAGLQLLRSRFFQGETLASLDYFMLVTVGGPKGRDQAYLLDRPGAHIPCLVVAEVLEVQWKLVGLSRLQAT